MAEKGTDAPKARRFRWLTRRRVILAVALLILLPALVWFVPGPVVPKGPVTWRRGVDGRFGRTEQAGPLVSFHFTAHAGTFDARDSLSSTTSAVRTTAARFSARRIAVFSLSDHPLVVQAAVKLAEKLQALDFTDEIVLYPAGCEPPAGSLAPDCVVTIDAESIDESGLTALRRLDAELVATAGLSMVDDPHGYNDDMTPPLVRYQWSSGLDHRSKTRAVATRSARYSQAAGDVGKQFGEAIAKLLSSYAESDGLLPAMPAGLYPAYQNPPEFAFLEEAGTERLHSWHGLMTSNDTLWRLAPVADPAVAMAAMWRQLEADGWNLSGAAPEGPGPAHLRCFKGADILTAFQARQPRRLLPDGSEQEKPQPLYVRYLARMPDEAVRKVVDDAITEDASADLLLVLSHRGSREQKERAMGLLAERESRDPKVWLALAAFHRRGGRQDAAVAALLRAYALTDALPEPAPLRGEFDRLAKDLGLGPLKPHMITPELLRQSGYVELTPGMDPVALEVGEGEAACFFMQLPDGQCATSAIRAVPTRQTDGMPAHELAYVTTQGGTRGWGRSGWIREGRPNRCLNVYDEDSSATFTVEELPGGERFRVTAGVEERHTDGRDE